MKDIQLYLKYHKVDNQAFERYLSNKPRWIQFIVMQLGS